MKDFKPETVFIFFFYFSISCNATKSEVSKIFLKHDYLGKRMSGHLLKVFSVNGLARCVYECMVVSKCLSLNYYPVSGQCELNSEDSVTSLASIVEYEEKVKFIDISIWTLKSAKSCGLAQCPFGQRCSPAPPSFACRPNECDAPPTVLHATLTPDSTTRSVKGTITYQCGDGLIVRGDPSMTCRQGFHWSKIKFRCASSINDPVKVERFQTFQTAHSENISLQDQLLVPGTCTELKQCDGSYTTDGEYWLYPAVLNQVDDVAKVRVYCRGMTSAEPKEYITLIGDNDARYNAREAVDYFESHCNVSTGGVIRQTDFQKIRLSPEDMTVVIDDYTFSSTTGGDPMRYGTAGDCTFAFACLPRQGYFRINTTNTGLIVDPTLTWKGTGWNPKMHNFSRASGGRTITQRCGGKCGYCEPDGAMKLEMNPDEELDVAAATMPLCL